MTKRCHMPEACAQCPFRRGETRSGGPVRLMTERIHEIVACVAPADDHAFDDPAEPVL